MAKHVYLTRRSVVLGITRRKMAENATSLSKKEKRKERERERRIDTFAMEYVRAKYPKVYNEAMGFYNEIREVYPEKCDLRKTQEFKRWKIKQQEGEQTPKPPQTPAIPEPPQTMTDNLELRIPLWDTTTLTAARNLETVVEEVLGEGVIYPSLMDEIPSEQLESIIEELREDTNLNDIFNTIEFEQLGADININEDNRLESELL